jgi:hypothetical protein
MSKRKSLLILLAIICSAVVFFYAIKGNNMAQNTGENQPESNSPPSEEPEFVVPESPLGTLALISALAAGFGIFIIKNKRKQESIMTK